MYIWGKLLKYHPLKYGIWKCYHMVWEFCWWPSSSSSLPLHFLHFVYLHTFARRAEGATVAQCHYYYADLLPAISVCTPHKTAGVHLKIRCLECKILNVLFADIINKSQWYFGMEEVVLQVNEFSKYLLFGGLVGIYRFRPTNAVLRHWFILNVNHLTMKRRHPSLKGIVNLTVEILITI